MTAEVGPAHQRAREFLARAAGDETYGKLVDENFDAGAFADEIIQRDRQRSLDDTGPSAAVAAVDAIKAYKVQLQTHIEDHVEESREALLKSSRGLRALRGDVEAVALAAREAKRKTYKMTRKLTKPYDSCERKTRRLRLVFEANELLRRAQRCRFALRRLDEKRGLNDPEDLASRAALVNEIEGLVDPPERDGKKPASLDAIDVCRGAKDAALAARAELETSSDGVLDEALSTLNVSRAGAALAVAAELGRIGEAVDRALGRLSDAARLCTTEALAGRDPLGVEEPLTAPFSKEAAQAHARRWASALRAQRRHSRAWRACPAPRQRAAPPSSTRASCATCWRRRATRSLPRRRSCCTRRSARAERAAATRYCFSERAPASRWPASSSCTDVMCVRTHFRSSIL